MLLIGIIIAILYLFFSEKWLKKKYDIQRKEGVFVKFVNRLHMIIESTLLVIAIIGIFLFSNKGAYGFYWVFSFFTLILLVRTIMQYIFEKELKEYILQLNSLIAYIVLFVLMIIIY